MTEISNAAKGQQLSANQVTNFEVEVRILPESYADLVETEGVQPLRSGMTATVDIRTQKAVNARCVPVETVTTREDTTNGNMQEIVFVVQEGVARSMPVKTGIQDETYILIEGLLGQKDGQIIRGPFEAVSRKLEDGDKVVITK